MVVLTFTGTSSAPLIDKEDDINLAFRFWIILIFQFPFKSFCTALWWWQTDCTILANNFQIYPGRATKTWWYLIYSGWVSPSTWLSHANASASYEICRLHNISKACWTTLHWIYSHGFCNKTIILVICAPYDLAWRHMVCTLVQKDVHLVTLVHRKCPAPRCRPGPRS